MTTKYSQARPRTIHNTIAQSEKLGRCKVGAQLLYDRMIAAADDQGLGLASGLTLRGSCFPLLNLSPKRIEEWRDELAGEGLIEVYQSGREAYYRIMSWRNYQTMRRAYPSRHPKPEGYEEQVYGVEKVPPPDGTSPPTVPLTRTRTQPVPKPSQPQRRGGSGTSYDLDEAWGEAWSPFLREWYRRAFGYPPTGTQDDEKSQRAILWPIVRDFPEKSIEWCRSAPKGATSYEVVAHVKACRDREIEARA